MTHGPFMTLVQRAATIALLGILAGGFAAAMHPNLKTAPEAPAPVVIPVQGSQGVQQGPHASTSTASPSGTAAAQTGSPTGAHTDVQHPSSAAVPAAAQPGTMALTGPDVTLEQAAALFAQGTPFVDARHRDEFEAGHVAGAYWLPAELFSGGAFPEAMQYLQADKPVVVYCGGGECDASKNVVILLQQAGFKRCFIMHDGYPGWSKLGKPTAVGAPEYEAPGGNTK